VKHLISAVEDLGDTKASQPHLANFPGSKISGAIRRFRSIWYKTWDWLEYSVMLDAAFCFPCRKYLSRNSDTSFVHNGFRDWKHATEKNKGFSRHAESDTHRLLTVFFTTFLI